MTPQVSTQKPYHTTGAAVALLSAVLIPIVSAELTPAAADGIPEPLNIVTVAGRDIDLGDGGSATSAVFNAPRFLAIDPAGNLLLADQANHRVRKIATNGVITTIAGTGAAGSTGNGGQATAASLNNPYGLALDIYGNLFVSEFSGNVVRKIDPSGTISTLPIPGSLNAPRGIAVDPTCVAPAPCNLFIVDSGNHKVVKFDPANQSIVPVAGTGTPNFSGDTGLATAAQLRSPQAIAFDNGNIYIADNGNNRVRKVAADGIISTIAGGGGTACTVASCPDGISATDAALNRPTNVAFDAGHNLYINDFGNQRVRRVDLSSNPPAITTVAGNGQPGTAGDGGPATSAPLAGPMGLALDAAGGIYVGQFNGNGVRKVLNGNISRFAGALVIPAGGPLATDAKLFLPFGVGLDSGGSLYTADFAGARVRKIFTDTTAGSPTYGELIASTVAGTGTPGDTGDGGPATAAEVNSNGGLTFDSAGNLYFTISDSTKRVSPSGIITTFAGTGVVGANVPSGSPATSVPLNTNRDVAAGAGNVYIADLNNHRVRLVDAGGQQLTTFAGNGTPGNPVDGQPPTSTSLNGPDGLAFDPADGALYIAERFGHRVTRVNGGTITRVAGSATAAPGFTGDGGSARDASLNAPFGMDIGPGVDGHRNLYISDSANSSIRQVDLTTGIISTIAGTSVNGVPVAGFSGDGGPATAAKLNNPMGVAVDPAGNIYIADSSNGRIRRLNVAAAVLLDTPTLNLNTDGDWVSASIALTTPRNAAAVDPDSIRLRALDPVTRAPTPGKTLSRATGAPYTAGPGAPGSLATVRFSRDALAGWATTGSTLNLRVEGRFLDGRYFSGDTTLSYALGPPPGLVSCPGAANGTQGNDQLNAGGGADSYDGHAGDDTITGGGGNDCLLGSDGTDTIGGGSGADAIDGGPGNDLITGGDGADLITGGDGNDTIDAQSGNDTVDARDGQPGDTVDCGGGQDSYLADPGDLVSNCETQLQGLP